MALVGALASGSVLYVKHISERALKGLVAGQSARTELQVLDGLEWRAISGRVPPRQIDTQLDDPAARMRQWTSTAAEAGLDRATAERLTHAQEHYLALVRQELSLLVSGQTAEAAEFDESRVDPAFSAVELAWTQAAARLDRRATVMRWISDLGVLLIVLLALGMTARIQHRRRIADARRSVERASEARYRALIEQSSDVVLVTDRAGRVSFTSPAVERLLADRDGPRDLQNVTDVAHPADHSTLLSMLEATASAVRDDSSGVTVDARLGSEQAGWRHFELAVRDLSTTPDVSGLVLNGRDVTDRHALQVEMTHRALHDALTGLWS